MRLAFVHGINNEHNTSNSIIRDWWDALQKGWIAASLRAKPQPDIVAPYYANLLSGATQSAAIEMGPSGPSTGLAGALLQEYADRAGVTQEEIAAAAAEMGLPSDAVDQGVPHVGWIVRFASVLENILPSKGKYMAGLFLHQAIVYINDKALAQKIDMKVSSALFQDKADPVIIIAHSLGTVVSYRILASATAGARQVPLFVTLGSPLSVRMFKSILPARGAIPNPPIGAWFNGRDKEDFVTLGRAITQLSIGFSGITDCSDIVGDDTDRHSILRYLSSPAVAKVIHERL